MTYFKRHLISIYFSSYLISIYMKAWWTIRDFITLKKKKKKIGTVLFIGFWAERWICIDFTMMRVVCECIFCVLKYLFRVEKTSRRLLHWKKTTCYYDNSVLLNWNIRICHHENVCLLNNIFVHLTNHKERTS